jgi:hypothetical protein
MLSGPCVVDSEHTCVVVINCDNYTLAGPALYQQDAMQWCPSRT